MYSVMIVEDEAMIRKGLCALIPWEKHGFFMPDTTENGFRALEQMEKKHYDLILTDVRMPKMDGLELIGQMRKKNIQSEIIVISGYRNFEYARSAIEFGVRNYLLKPVNTDELLRTLAKIRRELDQKNGVNSTKDESGLVAQVKEYVQQHYTEDVTMLAVGEALHYNPTYLGRFFQKEAGVPFRDYLNTVRITQAAQLLSEGEKKIAVVASAVGYKDINYFCRLFKKVYQVSPSEFCRK